MSFTAYPQTTGGIARGVLPVSSFNFGPVSANPMSGMYGQVAPQFWNFPSLTASRASQLFGPRGIIGYNPAAEPKMPLVPFSANPLSALYGPLAPQAAFANANTPWWAAPPLISRPSGFFGTPLARLNQTPGQIVNPFSTDAPGVVYGPLTPQSLLSVDLAMARLIQHPELLRFPLLRLPQL